MTVDFSYEYDNKGRKIKTTKYQYNSTGDKIICCEKIRNYHEDNELLRFIEIYYYNENGQKIKRRYRSYFQPFIPKAEEEDCYNPINNRLEYRLVISYTYTENQKKILVDREEYILECEPNFKEVTRFLLSANDSEKILQGINEHNYDKNKNLISEYSWKINKEGQTILNSKVIYEYDVNGKKSKKYSYKYNFNGELIEEGIYKYNTNNEPILYKQKFYKYDDKGILVNIDTKEVDTPTIEVKPISVSKNSINNESCKPKTTNNSKNTFFKFILETTSVLDVPTFTLCIILNIICGIWLICIGKWGTLFGILLNNGLIMPLIFSLILMIPNSLFSLTDTLLMKKTPRIVPFSISFISVIIYSTILTIWGTACLHTAYEYFKGQNNMILAYLLSYVCAVTPFMVLGAVCDRNSKLFFITNIYKIWFALVYLLFMLHNLFYNLFYVGKITIEILLIELTIVLSGIFMLVIIPMYLQWKILNEPYSCK